MHRRLADEAAIRFGPVHVFLVGDDPVELREQFLLQGDADPLDPW